MLQSAIFADLQVNNFGIPTVRFMPCIPAATARIALIRAWFREMRSPGSALPLNDHLRRDIGLQD